MKEYFSVGDTDDIHFKYLYKDLFVLILHSKKGQNLVLE